MGGAACYENLTAPALHCLLIGPRRIGKTSLLRRLEEEVPTHRPDSLLVYVDWLGDY